MEYLGIVSCFNSSFTSSCLQHCDCNFIIIHVVRGRMARKGLAAPLRHTQKIQ